MVNSEETTFIQVKRRKNLNAVEGVIPVRALVGTMVINNNKNGMIVTSAEKFSAFAKKEAQSANLIDYKINLELIDRNNLLELTKIANKNIKPIWQSIIDAK